MAKAKAKRGKAKPAAKSSNGASKRASQREADAKLIEEIKELRASGKSHSDIAKKLNIQATKALFLDCVGSVKPGERIKEGELDGDLVRDLRDNQKLAWHVISARTVAGGKPVGIPAIKTMYTEATGKQATGRIASGNGKPAAKKAKRSGKARAKRRARSAA